MDLLSDVMAVSGAQATVGTRLEAGGRWGLWLDDFPGAAMHLVLAGTASFCPSGGRPTALAAGDVVLLPAGEDHGLSDAPATTSGPCDVAAAARAREAGEAVRLGVGPVRTRIITLHFRHASAIESQLQSGLPRVVRCGSTAGERLDDSIRLLADELADPRAASGAVLDRMVDVILIQLLRARRPGNGDDAAGDGPATTSDPIVHRALALFHEDPSAPWSTTSLAAAVPVSRATLSRHFFDVLGQTPGAYMATWRMELAAGRLRGTDESVEAVAAAVGYASASAFNRAFSRARTQTPGRYRSSARSSTAPAAKARRAAPT